jgi:hypothetical protein
MEDSGWDMEQALSGLGLCPRSAELASPWHTGLLEASRVLSDDPDSSGMAGLFDIGTPDQPPPPPPAVTAPPGAPMLGCPLKPLVSTVYGGMEVVD